MGKKRIPRKQYERELRAHQIALGAMQRRATEENWRVCVVFEGRDAAGKDGTIKRIIENLPPRDVRAVALPKPTEREQESWYFQRYVPHFPAQGEIVLFNRSWYNRAGVEPVMGFCTPAQNQTFLRSAPRFEKMLADDGIVLIKYWLDTPKAEQFKRLEKRKTDPLKTWKLSPLDAYAQSRWDDYSAARNTMLRETDHTQGRWNIVQAVDKRAARLGIMADLLQRLCPDLAPQTPKREAVRPFETDMFDDGTLAP